MRNRIKAFSAVLLIFLLGACTNYFHELMPSDETFILSFYVDGQLGSAAISDNSVIATVAKGCPVHELIPQITVSDKATLIPVTLDYVRAAFPNADLTDTAMKLHKSSDLISTFKELVNENPNFNVPALTIPIDFTGPVIMFVIGGQGSTRQYTVNVVEDSGEPRLLNIRFSKYDNPELVSDALCMVDEANATVYANAVYPAEMDFLSYALVPSFQILGEIFEVDGNEIVSGGAAIQFTTGLGIKNKNITITRDGITKDYDLTILFTEDKDSIRSITDFRFNKTINGGISANAVGSIINTDNTGTITVQVFYSGAEPLTLTPSFVTPGTVSAGGVTQTSDANSRDFSSPLEYRVVSRNGMYVRTYTVRVEFINITSNTPHITSFRFSAALNEELVQDAAGSISNDTIFIDAYYGGTTAPIFITPEFSADGILTVSGSVQVSGASAQDFRRQVKYTVTNPEYPALTFDYWVQCRMIRDTSSDAAITEFGFYPEENSNLADPVIGKIDQINGKISVYAHPGSGTMTRTMYPRFTAAGKVSVSGTPQVSGESGGMFDTTVIYTVVSANGKNTRIYAVTVRELQTTIYVNGDAYGHGDGTSWENAFRNLKDACEATSHFPEDVPKEIWIAAGTYKPGTMKSDYFPITANTSYIGGFAGNETSKSQRNTAANTVIISGDLGGGVKAAQLFYASAINGDLLFENLRLRNASNYAIRVAGGNGDVEVNNLDLQDISGYGIYIYFRDLSSSISSIKLSNITANNISHTSVYLDLTKGAIILENSNFTNSRGITSKFLTNVDALNNVNVSNTNFSNVTDSAIYIESANNITIDRVNIDGVIDGRGIYGCDGENGQILITNSIIKNCKTIDFADGGGICFSGRKTQQIEISNTTIENVEAYSGGGIFCRNSGGELTISDCTIKNAKTRSYGGGIFIYGGDNNNNLTINNTTIENVEAYSGGGIFCRNSGGELTISDCTIKNAKARSSGGGICIFNNNLTINNTTIENVEADSGGSIYFYNGDELTISDCTIKNAKALSYGGGIYISSNITNSNNSNLTINNTKIENVESDFGGGIYCRNSGGLTISDCTIKNAKARFSGGGIYTRTSDNNNLTINNTKIENVESDYGGGIYFYNSGGLTISDCTIKNAKALSSGGGIHIIRNFNNSNNFNITINNTTIENVEAECGGGIYCYDTGSGLTISDCTIKNAKARSSGGGIYTSTSDNNNLTINNTKIENVESDYGGGIYFYNGGELTISDCTIKNAKARSFGGGICTSDNNNLTINNTTMELCIANDLAGAILFLTDTGTITNSQFINCTAGNGAKIFYAGNFALIRNCEFTHNAALPNLERTQSTNVYLFGGKDGNFENCTFNNLKGNMPSGQNYLFNAWETYPPYAPSGGGSSVGTVSGGDNLILKNCTFNLAPGSAGIMALYGGQSNIPANSLLMDNVTINDTGGQRPLIWLDRNYTPGTFKFKANNKYNGTLLNTQSAITGLVNSGVLYLTNGATPVIVP